MIRSHAELVRNPELGGMVSSLSGGHGSEMRSSSGFRSVLPRSGGLGTMNYLKSMLKAFLTAHAGNSFC